MSCPSGHVLKDKMCTIAPTMTCPSGYTLMNGMCQPSANGESEIMGFGDSMNIPPTQNGILSHTIMSDTYPEKEEVTTMSPTVPDMGMRPPSVMPMSPTAAAASADMGAGSPVSPMSMNNCPSGYSFNRSDNMCYPL